MAKTVFQRVWGILSDANGKTYSVQLDLKIIEIHVDELTAPVHRALDRIALASGSHVPNGSYALRFPFEGEQQKKVRVENDTLVMGEN